MTPATATAATASMEIVEAEASELEEAEGERKKLLLLVWLFWCLVFSLTSAGSATEGGRPSATGEAIPGWRTSVAGVARALCGEPSVGGSPSGVASGCITRTGSIHTSGRRRGGNRGTRWSRVVWTIGSKAEVSRIVVRIGRPRRVIKVVTRE